MKKEFMIEKAAVFPHVFMVLPIVDGKPMDRGTWAAYPNDESTIIWVDTSHPEAQKFYFEQIKIEEEYRMSRELTVNEDRTIKNLVAANMKAIKSILPKHLTPERFARIAYTSIVSNPKLARCSQLSLINAIIESSTLGLEIGGAMREAALIPFGNEATLVIEYPGLIKLAKNTGEVKNISAHPVFEKDEFRYNYGLNPDLVHTPFNWKPKGELIYAYCIIWYVNGGVDFEVIGRAEADAAKNKSAAKNRNDSPWNQEDNVPSMWVKTAIRRIMKRVPKAAEQRHIQVDGISGADMDHVKQGDSIIDLSPDDFHSIGLKDESRSEKNTVSKKTKEQGVKPSDLSKDVKQVVYLAEHFPIEYQQAMEELKFTCSPEDLGNDNAVKVFQRVTELVDAQQ